MTVTICHTATWQDSLLIERKDASITSVLDEAASWSKKRLAELDEERKRLERALAELGGKVTAAARAAAAAVVHAAPAPKKPPPPANVAAAAVEPAPTRRSS